MSVKASVIAVFEEVAREQKRNLAPLTDNLKLVQSGLDSLSFALIVARLEDTLGEDPFQYVDSFPVTFSDFVKLYEKKPA
jgi:aryl carrier-like protein